MKEIRLGSNGREVRILQNLLGLEPDGDYGPKTEAKVKKWQRMQGMTANGVCCAKTWASIAEALPGISAGSRGRIVMAAQLAVGAKADGIFGAETCGAVRAWQSGEDRPATGTLGPDDWHALLGWSAAGTLTISGSAPVQPVDYRQTDPRWRDRPYTVTGDPAQTIGSSGCGPTRRRARIFDSAVGGRPEADLRNHKVPQPCMADIIATWFDARVTPVEMCALAVKWGCRTKDSGTSHAFFKKCAAKWEFSGYVGTTSIATAKKALQKGALVIANMGPGYWTKGGHYILCWRYANGRIWANDPASAARTSQDEAAFAAQAKYFAIFTKE